MITKSTLGICLGLAGVLTALPLAADDTDTRPTVYLTFDDGPSADAVTDELLQLLAQYNAKATFFVTGQRVRKSDSKILEILYAGHAIGNHTYSHVNLRNSSSDEVTKELESASQAVFDAGGPPMTCFRPPFGSTDKRVNSISSGLGMVPVKWSLDTRDWDPLVPSSTIYDTLDRSTDGSIVLMHDGPFKRTKTLFALSGWMAVAAHRYQFKVLPQCQPYGAGAQFATYDEQEVDLNVEPETLQSLLLKLRSYRFSLLTETAKLSSPTSPDANQSGHITARLELQ